MHGPGGPVQRVLNAGVDRCSHSHVPFPSSSLSQRWLSSALVTGAQDGSDDGEVNPRELNVNIDEPNTDLPEQDQQKKVFRNVSMGVRRSSTDPLVNLCQETVDMASRRLMSTSQHTPWQMMHGLLGLRHDFRILHNGVPVSGLDWISQGQMFNNEYWFEKTQFGGRAHPYSVPYAFEGHANQFVAILSMLGVDLDHQFGTPTGPITMRQMIEHAKMALNLKVDEPTWTLWALSRYLPPDARWKTAQGEIWSIERLVQDQTNRPMQGAPCGGTHSLFALAHARNVYLRQGQPLRGVWLQAEYKIRKYINTARMLQNSNGTLSSNYFRGREYNPDFNKRMASAGHVLEFLMIALPQEELQARWVRRAIEATAQDLMNNRKVYVKCSPLYHSVNALNIYLDRVNPRVQEDMASADEPRTAMVSPTLKESSGSLKGVPAIGIAQSRDLEPVTDETKSVAVPSAIEEKSTTAADGSDDEETVPVLVDSSMNGAIARDAERWRATPRERQTAIVIPEGDADSGNSDSGNATDTSTTTASTEQKQAASPSGTPSAASATDSTEQQNLLTPKPTSVEKTLPPADDTPTENDTTEEPAKATAEAAPTVEPKPEAQTGTDSTPLMLPVPTNDNSAESVPATVPTTSVSVSRTLDSASVTEAAPSLLTTAPLTEDQLLAAKPQILEAVGLKDSHWVADVSGGSALFLNEFSRIAGPVGRVFAIDPAAANVERLEKLVAVEELDNVYVVRNDGRSLQLVTYRIDRALLCGTYGRFEFPRTMLESAWKALHPGSELVVFEAGDRQQLISAIEAVGFRFTEASVVENVPGYHLLKFQRPAE
ncbi:MAG: hypothetical protein R3C49_25865 [Planctomycetaceae bacterium]